MNFAIYNFAAAGLFKLVKFFKNFSKSEGGTFPSSGNPNCSKVMTFKILANILTLLYVSFQWQKHAAGCMHASDFRQDF